MIKSFKHKGLEKLFYADSKKGVKPDQARRLTDILDRLDAAASIGDMDYPGSALHPLKGRLEGFWAVQVSGNWRVTFLFDDGDASAVDYVDYH